MEKAFHKTILSLTNAASISKKAEGETGIARFILTNPAAFLSLNGFP